VRRSRRPPALGLSRPAPCQRPPPRPPPTPVRGSGPRGPGVPTERELTVTQTRQKYFSRNYK
ncbi:unnamed protein product, partial [Rangifer tarandus platyrhynchus]